MDCSDFNKHVRGHFFGRLTYLGITNGFWQRVFLEHFAAVVGLPAAAIASLFIVII